MTENVDGLPARLGRSVYAEADVGVADDPVGTAASWLARFEPWLGPCRSLGALRRELDGTGTLAISSGHDGDRATLVRVGWSRFASRGERWRVEGSAATLLDDGTGPAFSDRQGPLDDPPALPAPNPERARALAALIDRALRSGAVENAHG